MDPSTIPEDIYKLLDDETDHVANEDNVRWAMEAFGDILRTRLTKRRQKVKEEVLRFSALGKPDRQTWYAANAPEKCEKMPGKQNFKFLYGDAIEILLLFLTMESGHNVTHLQQEVEKDGVKGHLDAVIDGVVVDAKSASPYGYGKFADGTVIFDDAFGYIPQLSGYANTLGEMEDNPAYTERAGFLAAEKVSGDICFSPIDRLTIEANKPGPTIERQRDVISSPTPPPRCYPDVPEGKSGNRKLGVGCSYCGWKDSCWADANGGKGLRKFFYSRGPVWLTEVVKTPLVAEASDG